MKISICDNNINDIFLLKESIINFFNDPHVTIDAYLSGEELLNSRKKYDIIFMNYQLNGINGIQTALKLQKSGTNSLLVLMSDKISVAINSFHVNAFRFLLKPLQSSNIDKILKDCIASISKNTIAVSSNYEQYNIRIKDIIYIESQKNYCTFVLKDKIIKTKKPLYMFEQLLSSYGFLRCHRSYIINPLYISSKNRKAFTLNNSFFVPISYSYNKLCLGLTS